MNNSYYDIILCEKLSDLNDKNKSCLAYRTSSDLELVILKKIAETNDLIMIIKNKTKGEY